MDLFVLRARELRNCPTLAENRLWQRLRARQLGAKFRRQHPVGPYILDFYCPAWRLGIEVDGGQHAGHAGDRIRDAFLATLGIRVLRFWNGEVLGNLDGVLERITGEADREDPP